MFTHITFFSWLIYFLPYLWTSITNGSTFFISDSYDFHSQGTAIIHKDYKNPGQINFTCPTENKRLSRQNKCPRSYIMTSKLFCLTHWMKRCWYRLRKLSLQSVKQWFFEKLSCLRYSQNITLPWRTTTITPSTTAVETMTTSNSTITKLHRV